MTSVSSPSRATPPQKPVGVIIGAVCAVLLLASLGQTIVSTAMPIIAADLDGLDHITWLITAYLLASTVSAPIFGKLGDLYGRKVVMQGGILVFLTGSVIAGLAHSMEVLVIGRAVQGLGGGGLIVVAMAVVADVMPPRERGKAQGLMGSMFGISTVIGPLIGGFLVEQFTWHWIFFFNLPIGVLAYAILSFALPRRADHKRHSIDYMGAVLLTGFLSAVVMAASVGGTTFAWGSVEMILLVAFSLALLIAFIVVERRAAEPILPLGLFANNTFLVINSVGMLVGCAMFGTIAFLPLFLQVVKGVSPTNSGMFLVAMMAGLLTGSIGAGKLMSDTGRYKMLPILSTGLLAVGMLALATISPATPLWQVAVYMLLVGLGIGPVMSVGVAAIQNAIPVSMMGVGTASANMFRLIGGSVGTSAFGAIFAAGLARNLDGLLPGGEAGEAAAGLHSISAEMLATLPEGVRAQVLDGFAAALGPVFLVGAGLAAMACALSMLLHEHPLSSEMSREPVPAE